MTGQASFLAQRNPAGMTYRSDIMLLRQQRQSVHTQRRGATHVCRAMARSGQKTAPVTITSLRKLSKNQLVSKAQQLELEDNGTKEDLIGRLLAALNSGTGTHKLKQTAKQEDVDLLQSEVANLDSKLGALNSTLAETTSARDAERLQLATIIADMTSMRDQWQTDVQQVESLSSIAGDLERSERDILNLRSQQSRFSERIALMQRLLKERDEAVASLTAQVSELKQPALALAGAAAWGDSEEAPVATLPSSRLTAIAPSTWAPSGNGMGWDGAALSAGSNTPMHAQTRVPVRDNSGRQHKAPAVAILAALQNIGEIWDVVKTVLPQDKRYIADVLLAAGATAAYVNMFT